MNVNDRSQGEMAVFNTCSACGEYCVEKGVQALDAQKALAVCPKCGYQHQSFRLPLVVVTGARGVGKSTICLALTSKMRDAAVVIEGDIL